MASILTKIRRHGAKVTVDFPPQDEAILPGQYSFRLGAPAGAKNVEISIDQGDWTACREASGYWWFDWSGYDEGEHEVVARAEVSAGDKITSAAREFFVKGGPR